MSWKGAVVGGVCGFFLGGGPLGAIIGASVGHQFSKKKITINLNSSEKTPAELAFFTATFSVMGHIAKSDGVVRPEAIAFATRLMDEMALAGNIRNTAITLFSKGKQADFSLTQVLSVFYSESVSRRDLVSRFLEIQLQIALVDGFLSPSKEQLLLQICGQLRISRFDYERIKLVLLGQYRFHKQGGFSQSPRNNLNEAYRVLGLTSNASKIEVKKAYRRLMSQNHPDKLIAQGLSEDKMRLAKEKTQKITKAYELIQKSA